MSEEPATEAGNDDLLSATLAVAQTQLFGQIADETSLDGRTMGVLAFNGGLLAADVAVKDLLGPWWWTPLVAMAVSTVFCLISVFAKDTNLGPLGITFYASYGASPPKAAREQLLADLGDAFNENADRVGSKNSRLKWALGILLVGLVASSLTITLDRPTTGVHHGKHATTASGPASSGSRARARTVEPASRGS